MLAERIYNTLRFFDLQDHPLTAYEIQKFLIADIRSLYSKIDAGYELTEADPGPISTIHFDTILVQLDIMVREGRLYRENGFYALASRKDLITQRLRNHLRGLKRERRIRRYARITRHIPFVRSVALLGSQAMGRQNENSDIDLFVITDPSRIGLARFFLTAYFQILGVRRHGKHIADRFCLNHYLAGPRTLISDRNLFTAYEYLKHRPLVYPQVFEQFLRNNEWAYIFFPNAKAGLPVAVVQQSRLQLILEKLFNNKFGAWLERKLIDAQLKRIKSGRFTISNEIELSFHPDNRKQSLFDNFFKATAARTRTVI